MLDTQTLVWTPASDTHPPKALRHWLTDRRSLTAKLKLKTPDLSVKVLNQCEQSPHLHETTALGQYSRTIIREVLLIGNHQAQVFARSVIPLTIDTETLLNIGSNSLGERLFSDPNIHRGAIYITQLGNIWGRRSRFEVGNTGILVSEFFLESFNA